MDGIHDLGGRQGFGAVHREENEPAFHERWEGFVFTLAQAMFAQGLVQNADQFRHAIERIDPVAYLTHGYYGRWLGGLETLLREGGVVDADALAARVLSRGGSADDLVAARPAVVPDVVSPPTAPGAARTIPAPPAFSPGQTVRTVSEPHSRHTRLPGYARGRTGEVVSHQGAWVLPDTNAHGQGEHPEHLYCVRFSGETLWGAEAEPGQWVHLDLFESYLSPVGAPEVAPA